MDDKKIIFVFVIAFIVGYLDINFLLIPQQRSLKGKSEKISKLRKDIDNITREIEAIKRQPAVKQEGPLKVKQFISEADLPSLLDMISNIANKNKISLVRLKPSQEAKPKDDKTKTQVVKFIPINISLEVAGDYHNLGSFINGLENAQIFMSVEELKLSATTGNYFQQGAILTLKTYVKK